MEMYGPPDAMARLAQRFGRPVHLHRNFAPVRERPDIVNSVDMIRVIVREQNRIDTADARGDQLETQLRRSVDQNVRASIRHHQRADAGSLVPRVRRSAHLARASDLWNAKAGSRSQEDELQTVSTLSRLVVPGMSNGTPAVTMIRSPADASSLCTTTLFV